MSRSVLLGEDEALIRLMLAGEFEDAGLEVHEADSADRAMSSLDAGLAAEVVVTDVRMPGRIDGLGLATWLAKGRAGVPVVIVSGYRTAAEIEALNSAIVAVLSKPYDPADLVTLATGRVFRPSAGGEF